MVERHSYWEGRCWEEQISPRPCNSTFFCESAHLIPSTQISPASLADSNFWQVDEAVKFLFIVKFLRRIMDLAWHTQMALV